MNDEFFVKTPRIAKQPTVHQVDQKFIKFIIIHHYSFLWFRFKKMVMNWKKWLCTTTEVVMNIFVRAFLSIEGSFLFLKIDHLGRWHTFLGLVLFWKSTISGTSTVSWGLVPYLEYWLLYSRFYSIFNIHCYLLCIILTTIFTLLTIMFNIQYYLQKYPPLPSSS